MLCLPFIDKSFSKKQTNAYLRRSMIKTIRYDWITSQSKYANHLSNERPALFILTNIFKITWPTSNRTIVPTKVLTL